MSFQGVTSLGCEVVCTLGLLGFGDIVCRFFGLLSSAQVGIKALGTHKALFGFGVASGLVEGDAGVEVIFGEVVLPPAVLQEAGQVVAPFRFQLLYALSVC